MVIAQLLHYIRHEYERYRVLTIVAIHIDYANRPESGLECAFVQDWCARHDMVFRHRRIDEVTRGVTRREEYEVIARDIRYGVYKEVLAEFSAPAVCFGHHRGDVQENVISNLMRGLSLLELNGMSTVGTVNQVPIWRPLLEHDKDEIFAFAHRYGTPYFKDTTPLWSTRGKMRTRLMPLLAEMYGNGFLRNVSAVGTESQQCRALTHASCFEPFWNTVESSHVAVWVPCYPYRHRGIFFWKEALRQICHERLAMSMIRDKPMREFVQKRLQNERKSQDRHARTGHWITLKKDNRAYFTDAHVLVLFRSSFFDRAHNDGNNNDDGSETTAAIVLRSESCTTIGNWTVDLRLTDEPLTTSRLTLWDVLEGNGIQYVLPYTRAFEINVEKRIKPLRSIDKRITDVMPIVVNAVSCEADDVPDPFRRVRVTLQFSSICG